MALTSKSFPSSFVARVLLGAVALAGVAAAVPASAHPYDGRDWRNDHGWAERGYGPGVYEGYRHDWRPVHYFDRGYGHVVYFHGHDRRW